MGAVVQLARSWARCTVEWTLYKIEGGGYNPENYSERGKCSNDVMHSHWAARDSGLI